MTVFFFFLPCLFFLSFFFLHFISCLFFFSSSFGDDSSFARLALWLNVVWAFAKANRTSWLCHVAAAYLFCLSSPCLFVFSTRHRLALGLFSCPPPVYFSVLSLDLASSPKRGKSCGTFFPHFFFSPFFSKKKKRKRKKQVYMSLTLIPFGFLALASFVNGLRAFLVCAGGKQRKSIFFFPT